MFSLLFTDLPSSNITRFITFVFCTSHTPIIWPVFRGWPKAQGYVLLWKVVDHMDSWPLFVYKGCPIDGWSLIHEPSNVIISSLFVDATKIRNLASSVVDDLNLNSLNPLICGALSFQYNITKKFPILWGI